MKNQKFIIRQTNGIMRANVELTKEASEIWRAGDKVDQAQIRETVADAAKQTLKLDEVVVSEVLNS